MPTDPAIEAHQQWLGYVQPVGVVVSIPALLAAQAYLDRNSAPLQHRLDAYLGMRAGGEADGNEEPAAGARRSRRAAAEAPPPEVADFSAFAADFLGWPTEELLGAAGAAPVPAELESVLPDEEILRPDFALRAPAALPGAAGPAENGTGWSLLIRQLPAGADLDQLSAPGPRGWHASAHARMERLLRDTGVATGLLTNGRQFRLVYAPAGESSGYLTFNLAEMVQVAGRPILAAFVLLLGYERLFSLPPAQRLPAILAASRKYQADVSARLAEQVLESLFDLLRGFQAAHDASRGALLREPLERDPQNVYAGLLTVLLRLVFVLFAEHRGLLPGESLYLNHYSVSGLYRRLRSDHGRHGDTMDQRYGAWAHLLALFRLIHSGVRGGGIRLPARHGHLFDPAAYPFLEGRSRPGDKPSIPLVSDGVVFRILQRLLVLDGEQLSYRALDVEQIGSVYQAAMGFTLEVARGRSIAIKAPKRYGAPTTINLDELLATAPAKRAEWLKAHTEQKLPARAAEGLRNAKSEAELLAALESRTASNVTPAPVSAGGMILQPSMERRRSGSHYTPRSLTHPIVSEALRPVLANFGPHPTPDQILGLKICDLACGSAAFLVEACRQLSEVLVAAWVRYPAEKPTLTADEDELLHARRLIAQRCLYGLDKNPLALELAKLSLWLATLAKDHPFTFLDHALRHGEALVGLSLAQIAAFTWEPDPGPSAGLALLRDQIAGKIAHVAAIRRRILDARDRIPYAQLEQQLCNAESALAWPRLAADAAIAAFFSADKDRERESRRRDLEAKLLAAVGHPEKLALAEPLDAAVSSLHARDISPFHWPLEFPEVFGDGSGDGPASGPARPRPTAESRSAVASGGSARRTGGEGAAGGDGAAGTASEGEHGADHAVRGGFDVIVGNPPFAGKNTLLHAHASGYLDWLKTLHPGAHGNADLAAHFFRRAFSLLRPGGCLGLLATNTISQGDTRATGLRWICHNGGTIYAARRRIWWPGEAAVVVSAVHVCKGPIAAPYRLDGRDVPVITAFLFHAGGHDDPARLRENADKSFIGSYVLGMGFTFDDTDKDGAASPLAKMRELIASDPRNQERIFPYIGGEEVNTSPTHEHHRYVINFEDFPLARTAPGSWAKASDSERRAYLRDGLVPADYPDPVAADWPDLLAIVEEKVKPERLAQKDEYGQRLWWRFLRTRPELTAALRGLDRALVISRVGQAFAWTRLAATTLFADSTDVVAIGGAAAFSATQGRPHEIWARFFASSMKSDLRYTPSDCFETFPFPRNYENDPGLERVGHEYYDFRAQLMIARNEGLTKIYNRFHDPYEMSADIARLRALHDAMDRAVLDAYGWADLKPVCEFIEEAGAEELEPDESHAARQKFRYRWPDDMREEVLGRLLALNQQRAAEQSAAMAAAPSAKQAKALSAAR